MLIQHDCRESCTPHAWCTDCRALTCRHTIALFIETPDVRAAVAALPKPEPGWPVTRVNVQCVARSTGVPGRVVVGLLTIQVAEHEGETRAIGVWVGPN